MIAHNLPIQPTSFVGRNEELAEIVGVFNNPICRLLTLVGPGGIGKTRLAIEAARQLCNYQPGLFPNGVYFAALQPLTSPDFILSALAQALGFQFYPGAAPLMQLLDYLCPQTLLLVLDNFEHLLDGVEIVSDLLMHAPNLKILATSRETLNLQEEWLYPVKGLPFPKSEQDSDWEQYSAVRLFVQTACRVRPHFSLNGEREVVLRICQLVEGMPLALDMTAGWLKRLPLQQIVKDLEHGLDALESPLRNVPERHRSMRAVFEHSWNLLTEAEQDVFKKLSVFRGGFLREAAEAVTGASLGIISGLVDKSLLRVHSTGRYDLQELVRQFADAQLNATPQVSQQVHTLHCNYYADFLDQRRVAIVDYGPADIYLEALAEFKNVRLAWEWAAEQRSTEAIEKISCVLSMIYISECWYSEGEAMFGKAVGSASTFVQRRWDSEIKSRAYSVRFPQKC